MKLIAGIIFMMPFIQGLEFLVCSKNKCFKKVAKYKEEKDYEYINNLYAKCYIVLGAILGIFCNILNVCYTWFNANPKRLLIVLLIVLISELFMDTFVNIRLKIDKLDEELNKK